MLFAFSVIVVGQKTHRNALNRSIIMLSRNRLNGKRRGKKIAVNLVLKDLFLEGQNI